MAAPKVTLQQAATTEVAMTEVDRKQFRSINQMMMKDRTKASVARNICRKTALPNPSWKRQVNGCFGKHRFREDIANR